MSHYFWPVPAGGQAVVLRALAEAWTAMGHEVQVLTTVPNTDTPRRAALGSIRIERLPAPRWRYLGTLRLMLRYRRWIANHAADFDVILVSMLKYEAAAALSARRRARLPVVLRTEGAGPTGDVAWQSQSWHGRWVRRRCRGANAIIAVSREIQRELLQAGYPPQRTHFIPNAVRIPQERWLREACPGHRKSLGLPERPTICYTGRLLELKGLPDLLRALRALQDTGQESQLLLVGQGRDAAAIEALGRELDLRDRIRFVGHVDDVFPYLLASEVYVLPSLVEGMSIALLEALALGMPAVATDIEANRDLAPAQCLRLVPPRDPTALAAALGAALRATEHPSDCCRARIRETYSAESIAARYLGLFETLG